MTPEELNKLNDLFSLIRQQGKTLSNLREQVQQGQEALQKLRQERDKDARDLRALQLGNSFRDVVRRLAGSVQPFHYIMPVTLTASTAQVNLPTVLSADGWFFADRVFASWRPTAGAAAGRFMPLGSSDPTIATSAAPPADRLDFVWGYSDDRTSRMRQSQGQFIPGDLLYRQDAGYGYLLGGDAWAPNTTITVTVTPLVVPANAGVLTFTFLGEQCLQTAGTLLDQWVTQVRQLTL